MPLKNVNLTARNPAQPYDLQAQQMSLAQQAAIADALIAQSLQQSSPIIRTGAGNLFGSDIPNIGDPIAKVVQAIIGKKKREEANAGLNELNLETQRRTGEELDAITRRQFGGVEPSGMPPTEGQPDTMRMPSDPVGAVRLAQQATTPRGQALGVDIRKGFISPEEGLKAAQHFDPEALAEAMRTQNLGALVGRGKVTVEGDKAIMTRDGKVTGVQPVDRFTDLETDPETGLPVSKSLVTNKQFPATGGNVSTTRAKEIKDAETTFAELKKGREDYNKNTSTLSHIAQAEYELSRLPEGKLGIFSWFRNNVSKFGEAIGLEKLESTGGLEALHAALGNLTLEKVRALAPVTQTDVDMMRSIAGSESNTKRALEQILLIAAKAAARELSFHRDFVRNSAPDLSQNPDAFLQKWAPDFRVGPAEYGGDTPIRYDAKGNRVG